MEFMIFLGFLFVMIMLGLIKDELEAIRKVLEKNNGRTD